jgi:hypothetical protein
LQAQGKRPTGVTIIAILNIIGGIIALFAGISIALASAFIPTIMSDPEFQANMQGQMIPAQMIGGAAIGIGVLMIILGIASFVVAWGLLKGKRWAWTVTIILSIINIITSAVSMLGGNFGGIVSIIISGVIIYYLYRPHVKAYFGKTVAAGSSMAA